MKVWILTKNYYEDGGIMKVYSDEVKARQHLEKIERLLRDYSTSSWESSLKKSKINSKKFEELELDPSEWCYGYYLEEFDVE